MKYDVAPVPGYHPEVGILLASLADSTREWRENLESPTVEAITWQPWQASYSIGAVMLHMIDCEIYWFETFAVGKPEDAEEAKLLMAKQIDQDNVKWPTPPAEPIEWYFELHDRLRARTWETLRELTDPEQIFKGRKNQFTLRWILAHVLEHDSYHGGQVVLLHEMWKAQSR